MSNEIEIRTLSASDVAKFFLHLTENSEEMISNLKLQKLLYYAQGFTLAIFDRPLFLEPIVAWAHGPVVPPVYFQYRDNKDQGIPPPANYDAQRYPGEIGALLYDVYKVYGQFSAWKLRDITHEEAPWKNTPQNEEITHAALKEFFLTRIQN